MTKIRGLVMTQSLCPPDSLVSSVVMVKFLADHFGLPIYAWKNHGPVLPVDYLFLVNSSTLFTDDAYRKFIDQQVARSKRLIFVQNDYVLPVHSRIRKILVKKKIPLTYWTTVARRCREEHDRQLNWNALVYRKLKPTRQPPQYNRVLYFGSYRNQRDKMFKMYLQHAVYPLTISASSGVQIRKFESNLTLSPKTELVSRSKIGSLIEILQNYAMTLYLQDPYSDRNDTCPANRFYEALAAGTAQVFEVGCKQLFQAHGYDIEPYIFQSQNQIKQLLRHAPDIALEQRRLWRRDHVGALTKQVRQAFFDLRRARD